jgi:hypothetical protein
MNIDSAEIDALITKNQELSYAEIAELTGLKPETVRKRYTKLGLPPKRVTSQNSGKVTLEEEVSSHMQAVEHREEVSKYKGALEHIQILEKELKAKRALDGTVLTYDIKAKTKGKRPESTAFAIWSDWHIEQRIEPRTVSGLNEFNPQIAKERAQRLFQKTVDFIHMFQQDTDINTLVVALLGDFINGNIHEELMETNYMLPVEAAIYAQNIIASGIEYLLEHTDVKLVIPCHSGNHPRITRKIHHASEAGNSLEFYMYHNLKDYFRTEKRVEFLISDGYHSYLNVYGRNIRFHHGHNVKFGGGIGGLFIPAYKAISQWNKARPAELDVFGHFHQTKDGGNFRCNGSLVGYDTFALSIKADYEPPRQDFFLYHQDLGRTISAPIYL